MVRFIIKQKEINNARRKRIYIPIWLDLLLTAEDLSLIGQEAFTFQYG